MHVLVAEDEKKIAAFVRKGLAEIGCTVTVSHRGDEALHLASNDRFDALVLDIMMPGRDGLSVLRSLREQHNPLPVILLTARDSLNDRIDGLNQGADDYLAKPFSMEELIARLRAVARRLTGEGVTLLRLRDLSLNLSNQEVRRAGKKIELTSREFSLLACLLRSPGRVHSRTQLCEQVWSYQFDPGTNLVDVAIQRLRKKIDGDYTIPLVHTVRGVGYTVKTEA
jgi:hypothetical protein